MDYEVLGIDRERWHVLGFEVYREWENFHNARAFAVDRSLLGDDETFVDLQARNGGKLPLVKLEDLPTTADDVIRRFKRFHMMVWEAHGDTARRPLEVTETISLVDGERDGDQE